MDILNQASTLPAGQVPSPLATPDQSSVPAPLAPAVSSGTADLESRLPGNIPLGVSAAQTSDDNNQRSLTNPDQDLTGPKTGFLDRLKNYATSPSGISGILGGVGTSLALAAGGPKQKELAVEQEQIPLKQQQLSNEAAWRNGMLGVNNRNAATKEEVANTGAKTEQDKYSLGDAAMNQPQGTLRAAEQTRQNLANENIKKTEALINGRVLVTPEAAAAVGDPSLANKELGAMEYSQRVTNPIKIQLAAAGGAKTVDMGSDGVFGYNALTHSLTRLGDSPSVARSNAMMLRTQIPETDAQGNTVAFLNPQTKTRTAVSSIGGAGNVEGVIPPKPAATMIARGQIAASVQAMLPGIKSEIQALGDEIGASGGRWHELWVNRAGFDNPKFAHLDEHLHFLASGTSMAHFGASAPLDYTQALEKRFGEAQSPADLIARIDTAGDWLDGYSSRVGQGKPKAAGATPAANTPAAPTKPASFADWKAAQAKPTGGQ